MPKYNKTADLTDALVSVDIKHRLVKTKHSKPGTKHPSYVIVVIINHTLIRIMFIHRCA